ncbi:uncharacterized protein CLUP02_05641 [Colletotrichum lupini]|uniref:Methyltransferase domain-containing protein n=1 Tax=Colletotrichum lupini TaxID=145971 RepID=A0A9Q8SML3_9PEZI|nr:uncharacterized protein CLUP02_05641 [Colletotrichum lupini]UQC80159.1 hypothetical protein CLUP02_05641 [Colletotrichum lupini]
MAHDNIITDLDVDDEGIADMHSIVPSSVSLRKSLLEYRTENGRTYHRYKDGSTCFQASVPPWKTLSYPAIEYNLPNDEKELDRLDLQHHLWLLALDDKLGMAPPCMEGAQVGRVLDVGTGSGIWVLDFGDEHPESEVYGIDLSPTLPIYVPPNVKFEVDDAEEDWTWSRPFSYIHSRVMTSSIDDGTLTPEHPLMRWCSLLLEASEKFGRPYVDIPPLKDLLVEVGFVDVSLSLCKWPTNTWPKDLKCKEIGMWHGENVSGGLEGFTMAALTRALKWTPTEVEDFLVDRKHSQQSDMRYDVDSTQVLHHRTQTILVGGYSAPDFHYGLCFFRL